MALQQVRDIHRAAAVEIVLRLPVIGGGEGGIGERRVSMVGAAKKLMSGQAADQLA